MVWLVRCCSNNQFNDYFNLDTRRKDNLPKYENTNEQSEKFYENDENLSVGCRTYRKVKLRFGELKFTYFSIDHWIYLQISPIDSNGSLV